MSLILPSGTDAALTEVIRFYALQRSDKLLRYEGHRLISRKALIVHLWSNAIADIPPKKLEEKVC